MTTDKQDSRVAFEVSMVTACGAEAIDLRKLADGNYKWKSVEEMWSIWQASREQALASLLAKFDQPHQEYFGDAIQDAIRSLK